MGTEFVLDTRYELIKPIGHGAYGVVISAMDHVAGSKVRRSGGASSRQVGEEEEGVKVGRRGCQQERG